MPSTKQKAARSRDTVSRTVRGAVQMGTGEVIIRFLESFSILKLSEDQHVALLGVLTLLVTLIQNVGENADWFPALLKPKK